VITGYEKLKTTKSKKSKKYGNTGLIKKTTKKELNQYSKHIFFFDCEPEVRFDFAVKFSVMLLSVFLWVKFRASSGV
jgi:hypothetical protein